MSGLGDLDKKDKRREVIATELFGTREEYLRNLYPDVVDPLVDRLLSTADEGDQAQQGENARRASAILHDLLGAILDGRRRHERVRRRWEHQRPIYAHVTTSDYEIDISQFLAASTRYQEHAWMHTEYLDWLVADVVIWAVYRETVLDEFWSLEGVWGFAFLSDIEASRLKITGLQLLSWAALAFGLYWAYKHIGAWSAVTLFAVIVGWQIVRLRLRAKALSRLNPIIRVYNCLRGNVVAWAVVASEMEDARRKGTQWPAELWRLVDLRQKQQ